MNRLDYSLDLIRRINEVSVSGVPVHELFSRNGISLWGFHQQRLWESAHRMQSGGNCADAAPVPLFPARLLFIFLSLLSGIFLLASMRFRGKKVLVYSIQKPNNRGFADFRLGEVYAFLRARKIPYGEVVHCLSSTSLLRAMFRGRPAGCLTGLSFLRAGTSIPYEFDISGFSDGEKQWALRTLRQLSAACAISVKKIDFLKRYLPLLRLRMVLALDDPRYYNELMVAAGECGIPFYVFQHGRFNKYLVGWMQYGIPPRTLVFPSAFFVWNGYWREKILGISPFFAFYGERVRIGGRPFVVSYPRSFLSRPLLPSCISVLIPYEDYGSYGEINRYIEKCIKDSRILIFLKLKKDVTRAVQLRHTGWRAWENYPRVTIITEISSAQWNAIDVVAGTYSTLLYEAIECRKPVVVMATSGSQEFGLVAEGLVSVLRHDDSEVYDLLRSAAATDADILERRARILTAHVSVGRVMEELTERHLSGRFPAR